MTMKMPMRVMRPNDPKLSDGGAWRGSCEGGAQKEATDVGQSHDRTRRVQARTAATVTRGAVRCSAWLGVADVLLPVIGLGCCFDYSVALDKEGLHVAREEKRVGDAAKDAKR